MYGNRKGNLSGSASSILERAKGQLQGRRYGVTTRSAGSLNKTAPVNEEDDLNAYLSQLSKTTGKNTRTKAEDDDDDDDLSDLVISSEEDLGLGLTNSSFNASKFLKKSHSQTLTSDAGKQASGAAKPIRKSSTTPNFLHKTAPAFTSNALQKAAQLGAKFAKKKAALTKTQDADSDDELNFKPSSSIHGRKDDSLSSDKISGNQFLKSTSKKTFYVSESDDVISDDSVSGDGNRFLKKSTHFEHESDDDNFGRAGNKFLKKPAQESDDDDYGAAGNKFLKKSAQSKQESYDFENKAFNTVVSDDVSSEVSLDEVPASRFLKKKLSGTTGPSGFSTSTPKKDIAPKRENDRLSRTAPMKSVSHLGMSLDSDEEDMKDFIDNLTPTSTPEVPPIRDVKSSEESEEDIDKDISKPAHKRTLTPGPGKQTYHVSSESSDESVGNSVSESISEAVGGFGANVMQIEDLLPATSQTKTSEKVSNLKDKKKKKAWSESEQSDSISSENDDMPAVNLAGLQTVDDLLKNNDSDKSDDEKDQYGYGSDFETVTEIATHRTEEIPEESYHSEIQTARRTDTRSSVDSVSKSITDSSTRTIPDSYTSDSRTSTYSKTRSYSRSSYTRSKTRSGKRSSSEQTQTYSEDFQSGTHDGTDTEADELPSDDRHSSTMTQSKSYTSYSETTTVVTPKKKRDGGKSRRSGMKDASVQADSTEGLLHHWITDSNIENVSSLPKKDPMPITTHIVNPEALEALTNFSPSLLALNDSILGQLQHARESVQNSLRLHRSLVGSIENDYEYITLDNTKEYIAKQRSRRPKLTMEQALIMVKQEMEDEDRL